MKTLLLIVALGAKLFTADTLGNPAKKRTRPAVVRRN